MYNSLRSSYMIFHVVANNSNVFPCLEIIGVFNFQTDARIGEFFTQKFFTWKFLGTKIFGIMVPVCKNMMIFHYILTTVIEIYTTGCLSLQWKHWLYKIVAWANVRINYCDHTVNVEGYIED